MQRARKVERYREGSRAETQHPAMKRAVLDLKAKGDTTFVCLSNSNVVYIGTILEVGPPLPITKRQKRLGRGWADTQHHNLETLFQSIITNPAHWGSPTHPDRLHVGRRLPATEPPHGCTVGCLANMCKGAELDAWLASNGGKDSWNKIVYVGDGGNDFCPLLRMRRGDWALVRKGFELEERVREEGKRSGLEVDVKLWEQAWQVDE